MERRQNKFICLVLIFTLLMGYLMTINSYAVRPKSYLPHRANIELITRTGRFMDITHGDRLRQVKADQDARGLQHKEEQTILSSQQNESKISSYDLKILTAKIFTYVACAAALTLPPLLACFFHHTKPIPKSPIPTDTDPQSNNQQK